jgi:hypothetical protein
LNASASVQSLQPSESFKTLKKNEHKKTAPRRGFLFDQEN